MIYRANADEFLEVLGNGQGTDRVGVPSNGDVDGQLNTVEEPQAGFFHIGSILEVPVQLLGDRVRNLIPWRERVEVSGDLSFGSTRDTRIQGRGSISPRNLIDESVVGLVLAHGAVVQQGIFGDEFEIGDFVFLEFIVGDIENLAQVDDFTDGENTTKRQILSSVLLQGADEQGPKESSIRLSKHPGDEAIGRPVAERLSDRRGVWPYSEPSVTILPIDINW